MEAQKKLETHRQKYRWTEDFKGNRSAQELKAAIETVLANHQLLECFKAGSHFHVRIEASAHLPLTITKQDRQITVGHYFKQDGDTYADPAMELEENRDGGWYPICVELADGNIRQCADGPLQIDFEERRKQVAFAAKWAADFLTHGYQRGEISQLWGEND